MVVRNATATPELTFPADALHLVPGLGSFTCCMMAHDNGDGPGSRPCDRPSVASIMDTMINYKVRVNSYKHKLCNPLFLTTSDKHCDVYPL